MTNVRVIDRLTEDILKDEYLLSLLLKLTRLNAVRFFGNKIAEEIDHSEFIDLLRFADILSNSDNEEARNRAYEIISLLAEDYGKDRVYKTVSTAVLAKLGNFPGLRYLKEHKGYSVELPLERELERKAKVITQAVPGKDDATFTDVQFELFSRLKDSSYFSFSGPTSLGKSFIIRAFVRYCIEKGDGPNIVVLVPTRALINQFSIDLKNDLKDFLVGHKFKLLTNSNISQVEDQSNYILVLTPERFSNYLATETNPIIKYLFVDEAQKLAAQKDTRSITYYNVIERALRKYPDLNVYFSSPNVRNPGVFLELFKKDEDNTFRTIEMPVSQNLFFVDLARHEAYVYPGRKQERINIDAPVVIKLDTALDTIAVLGEGEQNLIYCNRPIDAVGWATKFANRRETKSCNPDTDEELYRSIKAAEQLIHKDYFLIDCLKKKVAFHFGNLPQMIRYHVEELFRNNLIDHIFCTSTLLEGVNLPAKNVFIVRNKVGVNIFGALEFNNLAGRAGRLTREMSGNIVCIKETEKDWKDKDLSILEEKETAALTPSVYQIRTKLDEIEQVLADEGDDIRPFYLRDVLNYLANVVCIYSLENYENPLKKEIEEKRVSIKELVKKRTQDIVIPVRILNTSPSIGVRYQNIVYKHVLSKRIDPQSIILPSKIDFDACKRFLDLFYNLYEWEKTELGHKKLKELTTGDFGEYIKYLSVIMSQWINGESLNQIINYSLVYHEKSGKIYVEYKPERFSRANRVHVNTVINDIINDIENKLRFTLEKYFNNYYSILCEVFGEQQAGSNWAIFLEYGTRDANVIALQNLGFSRHLAGFVAKYHGDCVLRETGRLVGIDFKRLLNVVDRESIEYDEISTLA